MQMSGDRVEWSWSWSEWSERAESVEVFTGGAVQVQSARKKTVGI